MNQRPARVFAPALAAVLAIACAPCPALAQEAPDTPDTSQPPVVTSAPAASSPASATEPPAKSESKFHERFFDDTDGKFDFSKVLARGGFLPVPVIITEPAVDGGFGLVAQFIKMPEDHTGRVSRTMVGAVKTGNGSYGYGAFRSGYALDGRISYKLGVGGGKITLDAHARLVPNGLSYTNKYKYGVLGSVLYHLSDQRFSFGPIIDFRKLSSKLNFQDPPEVLQGDFNQTMHTGALGAGFHFDSRDNPITPTQGVNTYLEGKFNSSAFGSDRDFQMYQFNSYAFTKLSPQWRIGIKGEFDGARGKFPLYFAPAINLRGVEAQHYQGSSVMSTEVELTHQLNERWSILAFAGMGAADDGNRRVFSDSGAIFAGGGGFRYRIARKLGLDAGLDLAVGPGGATFYIQFGHAWSFGMD